MCVLAIIIIVHHVEGIVSLISLTVYMIDPIYPSMIKTNMFRKVLGCVQYLKLRI